MEKKRNFFPGSVDLLLFSLMIIFIFSFGFFWLVYGCCFSWNPFFSRSLFIVFFFSIFSFLVHLHYSFLFFWKISFHSFVIYLSFISGFFFEKHTHRTYKFHNHHYSILFFHSHSLYMFITFVTRKKFCAVVILPGKKCRKEN